jgi:hypothetical protein
MPATNFDQVKNDAASTLAAGYAPGAGSFVLAAGTGANFPIPTATNPARIAVMPAAKAYNPSTLLPTDMRIFQATGKSGDTLTGITAIEGYADDVSFAIGDAVAMTITAGTISDIQAAVNALENATTSASVAANVVYAGPTSGGAGPLSARLLVAADVPNLDTAKITTGTMATARLPALVGSGVTHAAGIVPDPGAVAGTTKFLREDATWAAPPGATPGGSNTQIQVNSAGFFTGYASFTYNSTTFVQTIGDASGAAQLTLNNNTNNNPTIKVNSTSSQQGLTIVVGAATVAQFHDTGLVAVGSLSTLGGMNFAEFYVQRASAQKLELGGGIGSTVGFYFTDPSATAGYAYQALIVSSLIAQVPLGVRAKAGQTGNLQQWENSGGTPLSAVDSSGRFVLATVAGTPTGTPPNGTMVYDTTANKIWVYNGAWKSVTLA